MRTLLIALVLSLSAAGGLSACSLYFGETSQSNQQILDAANGDNTDAGWGDGDAHHDGDAGCADAGDNGDAGHDDAGWPTWPDAPADAAWHQVDAN